MSRTCHSQWLPPDQRSVTPPGSRTLNLPVLIYSFKKIMFTTTRLIRGDRVPASRPLISRTRESFGCLFSIRLKSHLLLKCPSQWTGLSHRCGHRSGACIEFSRLRTLFVSFIFILQTQRGFVGLALQSSVVPLLTRYRNHLGTSDRTAHLEGLFTCLSLGTQLNPVLLGAWGDGVGLPVK